MKTIKSTVMNTIMCNLVHVQFKVRDTEWNEGLAPGLQAEGRGGAAPPTGFAAMGPPLHLGPGHAGHLLMPGVARKSLPTAGAVDGASWPHSCTCSKDAITQRYLL